MRIILLDSGYSIVHEFDDVQVSKMPKRFDRYVLTYKGKTYKHHGSREFDDELRIETFVEAEVLPINVTLGGS